MTYPFSAKDKGKRSQHTLSEVKLGLRVWVILRPESMSNVFMCFTTVKFVYRNNTFSKIEDLIDHLHSEHEHILIKESQTFQCWNDFLK